MKCSRIGMLLILGLGPVLRQVQSGGPGCTRVRMAMSPPVQLARIISYKLDQYRFGKVTSFRRQLDSQDEIVQLAMTRSYARTLRSLHLDKARRALARFASPC